jgi:C-terminal processing protease CtpA/Prc
MARSMTRGACAPAVLGIIRDDRRLSVTTPRVSPANLNLQASATHDLSGDAFRRLSDDVAYVKISALKAADVARDIDSIKNTKGLIIDIRNYPSDFPIFALGGALVDNPTPFATFTTIDLSNPGAFHFGATPSLTPLQPHYGGKVTILVDEVTQSSAEYHAMAFRTAPGAIVIGSTTAGADGNVSQISLPGGFQTMISGLGVFYPDKRPTQRVGIVPNIEVKPTIAGIRAGRDEVLERTLREILGPDVPADRSIASSP